MLPAALAFTGAGAQANVDDGAMHVLYLGADFSVNWGGKARRVIDVEGDSLVIEVDGVRKPLRDASSQLPILMESAMKLGRGAAAVSDLQGLSTFSEANNPHRASEQGVALAQDASAVADLANFHLRNTERATGATEVDQLAGSAQQSQLGAAQQAYRDSLHAQGSTTNSLSPTQRLGAGHDTFRLSFTLAAPRALHRPYAMVVVRFLAEPDNPRSAQVQTYPLTLARVDTKARRYHLWRDGLPPGHQLDRYTIHLYENGREIATSASSKRVELTTEDAFQYALFSHVADLKGRTQAPVPARDFWPVDLSARLSEGNRNRLVYVRVNAEGRPAGVFHDAEGKLPITDPDITALLPDLGFLPALANGKAVPGICRVNLGERAL